MTKAPAIPDLAHDKDSPFYVPPLLDLVGGLVHHFRGLFLKLGGLETHVLADQLRNVPLKMPIYVCGLARSGSTLLHEIVSSCAGVASHRLKDYPLVYTPFWWRQATAGQKASEPRDRPQRDRIKISSESPDSLEEMLWMAFFPRCHDSAVSSVLTAHDRHADFEAFYRAHVRKLLLVEKAQRYAAKANYHVARLGYLARLFPDVRFLIPVRAPVGHIASLARQHARFCRGQQHNSRALAFMRRSGHFEFGKDRRPINLGDTNGVRKILAAWEEGQEVRGWARCWAMVYRFLADQLANNAAIRAAARVVRFEDLCTAPEPTIRGVLEHCQLAGAEGIIARFAPTISAPGYYRTSFSAEELAVIEEETADVAKRWGY